MTHPFRRFNPTARRWCKGLAGLAVILLLWYWFLPLPGTYRRLGGSIVWLDTYYCYAVCNDRGDTLFLRPGDGLEPERFCLDAASAERHRQGCGVWYKRNNFLPWGNGTILTTAQAILPPHTERASFYEQTPASRLQRDTLRLQQRLVQMERDSAQLAYYLRTHSVDDEGYNQVCEQITHFREEQALVRAVKQRMRLLLEGRDIRFEQLLRHTCRAVSGDSLTSNMDSCRLLESDEKRGLAYLQTKSKRRLPGTHYVKRPLWQAFYLFHKAPTPVRAKVFSYPFMPDTAQTSLHLTPQQGKARQCAAHTLLTSLPALSLAEGSPVLDSWGNLLGFFSCRDITATQAKIICTDGLLSAFLKNKDLPLTPNMTAQPTTDTTYIKYEGERQGSRRQGRGILTTSEGLRWEGQWRADTLVEGTMTDSTGHYMGMFNAHLRPHGFGTFISHDKTARYEGQWLDGERHGFGVRTETGRPVEAGWWRQGKYLGEKMRYNSARVYGIDISRYQHRPERWTVNRRTGKRVKAGAPIEWSKLRITHLGKVHNQNAEGRIDYPVSFCFIKSTQGTTIRSDYYAQDAAAARRAGLKVGSYHFMSAEKGLLQARWFLRNTRILAEDLPPVLDVELTGVQIRRMGGAAALQREVLAWMGAVEKQTGKRCILYVSQNFVDKYLTGGPPEILAHPVWIARYGEYRPYMKLLFWQLSPHGRVTGIRGEVDIDVFNGGKEQFRQYVESGFTDLP